jgi:pilus assembly protein TadC
MFSFLKKYYVLELLFMTTLLYLFCAFIHLSFDIAAWSMFTRIVFSILVFGLILFSQYVAAMKGLRK